MKRALAITVAAAALAGGILLLPARPRLTHMDFVAGGPNALEFCSAENPRFLPVVNRTSPVTAALVGTAPYLSGREAELALTLRTNTGKAIGAEDLLPTGGRRLTLFAIDPSLTDFQALEPRPGESGEWRIRFTPRFGGIYRIFADFTPAATGQEMYASMDLPVEGGASSAIALPPILTAAVGDLRFQLSSSARPVHVREPVILGLGIARTDGSPVEPERAAGRGPELVAIDRARSGMVDLRLGAKASGRVSFADSGAYAIWAVARIDGREQIAPFAVAVQP